MLTNRIAHTVIGHIMFAGVHIEAVHEAEAEDFDPLRDGPFRYLGYANELGEAFAAWLPAFGVPASYCVALGCVYLLKHSLLLSWFCGKRKVPNLVIKSGYSQTQDALSHSKLP